MSINLIRATASITAPARAILLALNPRKVAVKVEATAAPKSKRTYYLTSEGKITGTKPEAFTAKVRATNMIEARRQFAA